MRTCMDVATHLRHHFTPVSKPELPMRLSGLRLLLLLVGCLLAATVSAQRVEGDAASANGPYETEVAVRSQGENDRNNGFARALSEVLGNLTGDRNVARQPGVGQEMRRARTYVRSYDYRQDEKVSPYTGAPTYQTTLIVRFDQDKVDGVMNVLALPIWAEPRPKPVLWMAIDDGSGPRLVGLKQADAVRAVLDQAKRRGYKLGLPSGNAAEIAAGGAIWRGDTAAIARLSSRYQPPMQLLGKMARSQNGWKTDWVFVDKGKVLSRWSKEDPDPRRAMASGADGTADALVRRYAKRPEGAGTPGTYRIAITGIRSADAYMRLAAALQKVAVLKRFTPVSANGDRLELDVELSTGMSSFKRLLDDSVLVPDQAPDDAPVEGEIVLAPGIQTFHMR